MSDVVLCECFARDGLQHETAFVPTQTKRALIERFAEPGPVVQTVPSGDPRRVVGPG